MTKEPEVHKSKDGSSTLYSPHFDQFYHNPNGAVSESRHVFFDKPGLFDYLKTADSLTVFEMGFGTGLNFLLLLDELKKQQSKIAVRFYSVEAFPIDSKTASEFNFSKYLEHPGLADTLPEIFASLSPGMNIIRPLEDTDIELHLFYGTFGQFNPDQELQADFIFHDPFSPGVNEELWTKEVFEKLGAFSSPETILSTYCAASKARAAMAAAGWCVAREQGALGKREMTIASRAPEKLTHLKRVNEEKLAHRYREEDF